MATAVSTAGGAEIGGTSQWAKRYPPLVALLVAVFIALVVLPSSLNVPQSNPSTTLEFAPVPPKDDTPPPPDNGNFNSLGLAGSSGLTTGGLSGGAGSGPGAPPQDNALPPPGQAPAGVGKSPQTKHCVGNPPKQSEDPLAPPCVADFRGDNFGATYLGVKADEINVLFYYQGGINYTNTCRDPNQATPDGQYFDLGKDANPNGEHCVVRSLRVWQTYFNDRFQTYGRFVHFYVYFSGSGTTPEQRKADAADNFETVHPFAVIHDSNASENIDSYLEAMARRGTLVFDASFGRDAGFFSKYAGLVWGYFPTQQIIANQYAKLLCKKVADQPAAVGAFAGQPRKYGLVYTSDSTHPELRAFKDLVIGQIKSDCGITISAQATFPSAGYVADTRYSPRYAQTAMADFQSNKITTIIWPGGLETNLSKAAKTLNYFPEWVVAGDKLIETNTSGLFQDQDVWNNAFAMTNVTAVADIRTSPCYIAYREADPNGDDTDARITGCEIYDYVRQLFTGIQVAGPKLTPESVDRGYHAIPRVKSTDPSVPACFYDSGDYTCVKDAMLERWDSTADNNQGCWRMVENGQRYFAEIWPDGNIDAQYPTATDTATKDAQAKCNTFDSSFLINNSPPKPGNL